MNRFLVTAIAGSMLVATGWPARAGPLHDAAMRGDLEYVRLLIEEGADPNEPAGLLGTPLQWALVNGQDEAARLLLEQGADPNGQSIALGAPLHTAASARNEAMVLLLLQRGADPNVRRRDGVAPLHVSAERGDVGIVRLLLDHGADPNALTKDFHRSGVALAPPLHFAEAGNHAEVAALLRQAGVVPPAVEPVAPLMARASAERGRDLMVRLHCTMCHSVTGGDGRAWGPSLRGVVGRPVAALPGFAYSPALRRLGGVWTEDRLYAFISHPMAVAPGTTMTREARAEPQERADLIAYLRTLADAP